MLCVKKSIQDYIEQIMEEKIERMINERKKRDKILSEKLDSLKQT